MSKLLTENNNHIFISGQTRSGKTYFASKALAKLSRPVLFLNLTGAPMPSEYMAVKYSEVTTTQLLDALKHGCKIDFVLPLSNAQSMVVISHVLGALMRAGYTEKKPIYVAMDECHLYEDVGLSKAIEIATRGLYKGCRAVFITQRPALANKTLYTQSAEQYIFYLPKSEMGYLKSKGVDYEACAAIWQKYGKYSYVFDDGFHIDGKRGL